MTQPASRFYGRLLLVAFVLSALFSGPLISPGFSKRGFTPLPLFILVSTLVFLQAVCLATIDRLEPSRNVRQALPAQLADNSSLRWITAVFAALFVPVNLGAYYYGWNILDYLWGGIWLYATVISILTSASLTLVGVRRAWRSGHRSMVNRATLPLPCVLCSLAHLVCFLVWMSGG